MHSNFGRVFRRALILVLVTATAACSTGGFSASQNGPFAPGVNQNKAAQNGVEIGHRLMRAGEYELAIKAFNRAALDQGMNSEILSGLGSANLGLGRLGQAETLLRRAVKEDDALPEVWNNLGVVLMERGNTSEAQQILRKAFALDNGESDAIRDNLRLALAKSENSVMTEDNNDNYKLVRRGVGDFLIRPTS